MDGQQLGRDTVLLERDTDTFLPRAVEPSVCIVCNLHVAHTDEGKAKAAADFRRIVTRAIQHRGRYDITYPASPTANRSRRATRSSPSS